MLIRLRVLLRIPSRWLGKFLEVRVRFGAFLPRKPENRVSSIHDRPLHPDGEDGRLASS